MRFAKGHGTGNDFLILPDPDDALVLAPEFVAGLCDRRTGLGADGVLRVVRVGADDGPPCREAAGWFMDYRNADGSIAEMCGNGLRVFARYLLARGLAEGPAFVVATRAGRRQVFVAADGDITVDMGAPIVLGPGTARVGGIERRGLAVSLGNPHLACMIDTPVADVDLSRPPLTDPALFPEGANVEVVGVRGEGHLEMRVYERGSGATLSCGTGAVAAAVAARDHLAGTAVRAGRAAAAAGAGPTAGPADRWRVDLPGGRLIVTLGGSTALLTGPAVIVAEGVLDDAWLAGLTAGALSGTG